MKGIEERLMRFARRKLSEKRLEHVEGVVRTIDELAGSAKLSRPACRSIAWLHDCAKEEPRETFLELVRSKEIALDAETMEAPQLWHGFHAAYWGRTRFGIEREELLEAVKFHPTGAPQLSLEGVALFVADYVEPGRPIEGAREIRELARDDLLKAALRVAEEKIAYVEKKGRKPHSRSLAFRDWLAAQS